MIFTKFDTDNFKGTEAQKRYACDIANSYVGHKAASGLERKRAEFEKIGKDCVIIDAKIAKEKSRYEQLIQSLTGIPAKKVIAAMTKGSLLPKFKIDESKL